MILIRKAQKVALRLDRERAFLEKLGAYIRARGAPLSAGLSSEELGRRVAIGVARARQHGLDRERSIAAFVGLMFAIGPAFDEHPAIAAALASEEVEPNARFDALPRTVDPRAWREAAALPAEHVFAPSASAPADQ